MVKRLLAVEIYLMILKMHIHGLFSILKNVKNYAAFFHILFHIVSF